jgi:hypothetical protein
LSNGASGGGVSDWITAVATALTALFAAVTGWAAMQAYRRQVKHDLPVIECDCQWSTEGDIGPHIQVRFVILNRLDETLVIHKCGVKKPKGATISEGIISGKGRAVPSKGITSIIKLDHKVFRSGTRFTGPPGSDLIASDLLPFVIFLSPPEGWDQGEIVMRLFISSKASTIRDKRITVKAMIPAATQMHSDANASK